ncbi:MAG: tetratricopeptide repeat protein [Nitrospira sp.]|nr:tetratricopeptide repeat protein [Nitrospira sp.]
MDASAEASSIQRQKRRWKTPNWQILGLIAIKYRRLLLGLAVALTFLFVQERLFTMDHRLLQPTVDGVRGLIHYQMGQYRKAAAAYRADLRNGGWREWRSGDEAYAALLKGDLSETTRLIDLKLMKQQDDIEAWLTQGEVALEEGNIHRASDAFDHAVSLDDKHFDALLLSAVAHSRSGDIDRATDRLRHALRHDYVGRRITAYLWALQTAGELRKDSPDGSQWCLLAHYYRYLRIFDPSNTAWARNAAIKAIDSGSRVDDAYITLGVLKEKTGDYHAALSYFLKAVETNPRNPEAYRRAANMYRHRGSDLLNEYRMWKGAYTASSSDGFYRDSLVSFLIDRFGDYPQALELVRQALAQEPQNPDLLEQSANLHQRLGKHEDAIRLYREILTLQPSSPDIFDAIGQSLIYVGRYNDAIASFQRALDFGAHRYRSHHGLGRAYAQQGRHVDSIREYETALQIRGDDIDTRAYLCTQYWAVNRYLDAEACLKHVLHHDLHNKTAMKIYPYVMKGLDHSRHER